MSVIKYKVKPLKKGGDQSRCTARLDISVGMAYHEGEKLKATVEWARQRYDRVVVSVADTLQRYNLQGNYTLSRQLGDAWLERNHPHLQGCVVQRWDEVLEHPLYNLSDVRKLYTTNRRFRLLIEEQIESLKMPKTSKENSVEYLLEEIAGFAVLFRTQPAVDIYPGSFLKLWEAFRKDLIPQAPKVLSTASTLQIGLLRKAA